MTTIPLVKPAPVAVVSAVLPLKTRARKAGRPARPWLLPWVPVPHPVQSRLDTTVPPATVALWTGKSRQTVARWASEGHITDTASLRLCQHYAHGLPPIPPDAQGKDVAVWAQFRFLQVQDGKARSWVLVTPGGESLNGVQVWAARESVGSFLRLCEELKRWRARALVLEAEAARLRDVVGSWHG